MRAYATFPFRLLGVLAIVVLVCCTAICFGFEKATRMCRGFLRSIEEVNP